MFNEDAKLVSRELDLTLTTRDRNKPPEERTPMCGVPYHSCESLHRPPHRQGLQGGHLRADRRTRPRPRGWWTGTSSASSPPAPSSTPPCWRRGKTTTSAGCTPDCPGAGAVPVRHLYRRVLCHLLSGGGGGHGPPEKRAGPLLSPGGGALRRGLEPGGPAAVPAGAAGLPL